MATETTLKLRQPRKVRIYALDAPGAKCRTSDGAIYQKTSSGAIVQTNKDRRSPKERKAARRAMREKVA